MKARIPSFARRGCLFAALLGGLLLVGCGDPDRSRLVGDWKIAVGKDLLEGVVEQPPDADPGVIVEDDSPKMLLRFLWSGQLNTVTNMGPVQSKKEGSWELVSFDQVKQQMRIRCELSGQTTEHDIEWIDENSIRLVPPNLAGLKRKLKFVRVQ